MRDIKMFEHVKLKDGREGAVIEILGEQEVFLIDIGDSPSTWETIQADREEIVD